MSDERSESEFNARSTKAIIAAWIGMVIGPNSMVSAPMSLFIAPLTAEFHLTRTAISAILLISPWANAFFSPLAGRGMDRWGLRKVLIPGIILFGLASMARGFVTSPWQLALSFFVVSIASAMNSAVGYAKLVSLWFSEHRGLVLGLIVALGAGLGSAVSPQIMRIVIVDEGWRIAYIAVGVFVLVLPLPLLVALIREPQRTRKSNQSAAETVIVPGLTCAEAVRTRSFWLILFAILLASMALIGTTGHAVPMLTERGFSRLLATTVISFFFFGGIAGQVVAGFVADRFGSSKIVVPFFASALVGTLVVHTATSTPILLGGALLMGLGQGAEIAFAAYLTSRYFGLLHYGSIYSLFYAISNFGIGFGILVMGVAHDWTGSYRPMTLVFGVALFIAVVLVSLLGPYPFPSRRALSAVRKVQVRH